MQQKIINFFKSPKIKSLKEVTTNQLLFALSDEKIATNSGDAYYFIRICKGMGLLKQIAPKTYKINWEILKQEAKEFD